MFSLRALAVICSKNVFWPRRNAALDFPMRELLPPARMKTLVKGAIAFLFVFFNARSLRGGRTFFQLACQKTCCNLRLDGENKTRHASKSPGDQPGSQQVRDFRGNRRRTGGGALVFPRGRRGRDNREIDVGL